MAAPARRACWAASDGGVNTVCGDAEAARATGRRICRRTRTSRSASATSCACSTPGGGGFGDPAKRKPESIARDVARGYYTEEQAREKFGLRAGGGVILCCGRATPWRVWPSGDAPWRGVPRQQTAGHTDAALAGTQSKAPRRQVRSPSRMPSRRDARHTRSSPLNDVSARGTAFVLHSYSSRTGGYSLRGPDRALSGRRRRLAQPQAVLQAALDARAQQLAGGKWIDDDWREIGGATAVEFDRHVGQRRQDLRQLSLLKEPPLRLARLPRPRASTGPEADRFFRSLKFK